VCCARRLAYSIYRKIRKIVLEDASPSPRSKQRGRSTRLSYIRNKISRGAKKLKESLRSLGKSIRFRRF